MEKVKIKTIQEFSSEEFDNQVLNLIELGYSNVGDLVVITRIGKEQTDHPFAFFQTFVWYSPEETEADTSASKEVKVTHSS